MRKGWTNPEERRYEVSKEEKKFLDVISNNGFKVLGIKEFVGKTDYLLEKYGIQLEASFYNGKNVSGKGLADIPVELYEAKKKLLEANNRKSHLLY